MPVTEYIPKDKLSRVSSYDDLLSYAAIPAGLLLVGPPASRWGAENVALACGIGFAAAAPLPLSLSSVRHFPDMSITDLKTGDPTPETVAN